MSARIHELQDALASSRAELEGLIAAGQVNSERGRELLRLGHANQQDLGRVTARRHAAMVDARAEASPFPDAGPPVDNASAGADQAGAGASGPGPPMSALARVLQISTARLTREPVADEPHAGASAQTVIAGTGLIAPAPGWHYMATGEYMKDPD